MSGELVRRLRNEYLTFNIDGNWETRARSLMIEAVQRIVELEQQGDQDRRRIAELRAFIAGVGNNCNSILRDAQDGQEI